MAAAPRALLMEEAHLRRRGNARRSGLSCEALLSQGASVQLLAHLLCLGGERYVTQQFIQVLSSYDAVCLQRLHLNWCRLMSMCKMRGHHPQHVSVFGKERRTLNRAKPGFLRVRPEGDKFRIVFYIANDDRFPEPQSPAARRPVVFFDPPKSFQKVC